MPNQKAKTRKRNRRLKNEAIKKYKRLKKKKRKNGEV